MSPDSNRNWVSLTQAATHLGVSTDTVRRMAQRGELYAERVGLRRVRVDLNSYVPKTIV